MAQLLRAHTDSSCIGLKSSSQHPYWVLTTACNSIIARKPDALCQPWPAPLQIKKKKASKQTTKVVLVLAAHTLETGKEKPCIASEGQTDLEAVGFWNFWPLHMQHTPEHTHTHKVVLVQWFLFFPF